MVFRVFVEKKKELANEAKALLNEANNLLGIANLKDVRVINRYDVENITEEQTAFFDGVKITYTAIININCIRYSPIILMSLLVRYKTKNPSK